MKKVCLACGSDVLVTDETSTNRWDCRKCKLAWLYDGLPGMDIRGKNPVITYYAKAGDSDWRSIPEGTLLVLEREP